MPAADTSISHFEMLALVFLKIPVIPGRYIKYPQGIMGKKV
jgi:hypothetical protein